MGIFNPPSTGGGGGGGGVTSVNARTGAVVLEASDILSGTFDIARIPVVPSQKQVVSSGTIANLSTAQQTEIGQGTIVTTTDGRRWVYTGTGSKVLEASYITLADVSPDWNAIDNKPTSFTPSAHKSSHATGGTDAITPADIGAEETITTLPITKGGTGATSAEQARSNLGTLSIQPNPQNAPYTLQLTDAGKYINISTGGVTIPSGLFASGDVISVYNNSASNQTITQGAGVTMYLAGTSTTGNRTLAQRGVATILCVGSNTFTIIGGGLT